MAQCQNGQLDLKCKDLVIWLLSGLPALVFAGDFWQLPGVNDSQATDSPKWQSVFVVNLHEMRRCKDQKLPTPEQLADICRGHKAWTHAGDPTLEEIEEVLRRRPDTTVVTCTRQKAAVNQLVTQALFEKLKPVLGQSRRRAAQGGIYAGMRVHLTRKQADFVNGMEATVRSLDRA